MSETKINPAPTRQIHVSVETYRALRHIAVDREVRLQELTEEVISAGLSSIHPSPAIATSSVRSN